MSYLYYRGGDGAEFCYSTTKEWRCPYNVDGVKEEDIPEHIQHVIATIDGLGLDGRHLLRHRGGVTYEGKTPGRCRYCGGKLEAQGWRAWKSVPDPEEYRQRIADRLGLGAPTKIVESHLFGLRREAKEWARENARISKSIANEERAAT
jgi:hypothetical protein